MKIGIMYVLHGRKTSIPQKLYDIVKDFSDTLDLPQAIGMLEGQQHTLEGCCQGAGKTKGGQNNCRSSAAFPGHARSGGHPATHAGVRWGSV